MEEIYEIKLLDKDYEVKVACANAIDKFLIANGYFILASADGRRVASLMVNIGDVSASIWEVGTDGIYRNKMDINITLENKVQITKMMPDGSERRTDIDIVL
jgi:hypothetical protein